MLPKKHLSVTVKKNEKDKKSNLSIYDWICFPFTKKLAYIIIKFYSLGVVVMYSLEGPQNYRTCTANRATTDVKG